jgi:hypothetical protein
MRRSKPITESTKRAYLCAIRQLPAIADKPLWWVARHPEQVEDAIAESSRRDGVLLASAVKKACDRAVRDRLIDAHDLKAARSAGSASIHNVAIRRG